MSKLFLQCFLLVVSVHYGSSRPQGAPLQACGTMIPGHSGSGENSQSPFTTKPTNVSLIITWINFLVLNIFCVSVCHSEMCDCVCAAGGNHVERRFGAHSGRRVREIQRCFNNNLDSVCLDVIRKFLFSRSEGFLVMAFDNSTESISKPLGTFTADSSSQTIDCSSGTKVFSQISFFKFNSPRFSRTL